MTSLILLIQILGNSIHFVFVGWYPQDGDWVLAEEMVQDKPWSWYIKLQDRTPVGQGESGTTLWVTLFASQVHALIDLLAKPREPSTQVLAEC